MYGSLPKHICTKVLGPFGFLLEHCNLIEGFLFMATFCEINLQDMDKTEH